MKITLDEFRKKIELSLVNQYMCEKDVKEFCENAGKAKVGVVCINPIYVKMVKLYFENSITKVSANIGFPFGTNLTATKVFETKKAINDGADQIDMVINVGALRSNKDDLVYNDIKEVVQETKKKDVLVKAIIEIWALNNEEKKRACLIAESAGAGIIKTTTGVKTQYLNLFNSNPKGVSIEEIILMRKVLNPATGIKASGGIYSLEFALDLLKVGVTKLGVSKGIKVIEEFSNKFGNEVEI